MFDQQIEIQVWELIWTFCQMMAARLNKAASTLPVMIDCRSTSVQSAGLCHCLMQIAGMQILSNCNIEMWKLAAIQMQHFQQRELHICWRTNALLHYCPCNICNNAIRGSATLQVWNSQSGSWTFSQHWIILLRLCTHCDCIIITYMQL